jgi:hypothetical protein
MDANGQQKCRLVYSHGNAYSRIGKTSMLIKGSCHCGNISFGLDWQPDPAEIAARECSCSFCVKRGGVWTSNPAATLEVAIKDAGQVSRYAFGTRTADFHVCARCGGVPVVTSDIAGRTYAVVSVNAFDNVDPALLRTSGANFDGEATGDRLARRQRNWIGTVTFVSPS